MRKSNKKRNYQSEIIEKYLKYANTSEAFAVLFAKKHLRCYTNQFWADIVSHQAESVMNLQTLEFSEVVVCLYPRKIRPVYPDKVKFIDSKTILPYETLISDKKYSSTLKHWESEYTTLCRAITWDISHEDMSEQKALGVKGTSFVIKGRARKVPPSKKGSIQKNSQENNSTKKEEYIFEVYSVKKVTTQNLGRNVEKSPVYPTLSKGKSSKPEKC